VIGLPFLAGLWGRIGPTLAAVGALLLALATFGAFQRRAGRRDAAAEQTEKTHKAAETRREIDDDVRRSGGAAGRLRREWGRD
jgi:hypothetical protein